MRYTLIFLLIFIAILATNAKTFRYPLKTVHRNATHLERRLSTSYPLKYVTEFTMNVGVGDPVQAFNLVISTGVPDIMIADGACNNCGNPSKIPLYHGELSNTYKSLDESYNAWDAFYGTWTADIFHLFGRTYNRYFARGYQVPSNWVETSEYSGMLGLSLFRPPPYSTLTEYLFRLQLLDKPVFSCRFVKNNPDDAGEILFGAIDESQIKGRLEITNVIITSRTDYARWVIEVEDIIVGYRTVGGAYARVDTAITHIYLPHDVVGVIYEDTGAVRMDDGMWAVPENWALDLKFLIGHSMFTVPKDDIPLRQFPKYGDRYMSAIQETDGECVLGIPFIQNVYVVFDFSNNYESVGIADRNF